MTHSILGGFEHQVLLAMARLGSETYTVPIVLELELVTRRKVAPAKVYVTLTRLEDRGLVASRYVPPNQGEGGRHRRVFSLRATAIERLRESKRLLSTLWEGLSILDEA